MTQGKLQNQSFFSGKIDRSTWTMHLDSHHQLIDGIREFLQPFHFPLFTERFIGTCRASCLAKGGPKSFIEEIMIRIPSSDRICVELCCHDGQAQWSETLILKVSDIVSFPLSSEPLLKTRRLEIRLLLPGDELALTAILKDSSVWQMRGAHYSPLVNVYSAYAPSQHTRPWYKYYFSIRLSETDETVGFIGFYQISKPSAVSPFISQVPYQPVMLSYALSKQCWHQGLMSEALSACVSWFINDQQISELVAFAEIQNLGSRRLLQKLGMQEYGLLENSMMRAEQKDTYEFMIYKKLIPEFATE